VINKLIAKDKIAKVLVWKTKQMTPTRKQRESQAEL